MSFATMGDDIAALLDHLKIPKADLVGHSFGGAAAIRAAIQHPGKVRRLVVISSPLCQVRLGIRKLRRAWAGSARRWPKT
jgi:pimeloyl-ACP methyl ester carboxylesterase